MKSSNKSDMIISCSNNDFAVSLKGNLISLPDQVLYVNPYFLPLTHTGEAVAALEHVRVSVDQHWGAHVALRAVVPTLVDGESCVVDAHVEELAATSVGGREDRVARDEQTGRGTINLKLDFETGWRFRHEPARMRFNRTRLLCGSGGSRSRLLRLPALNI